jgi:hypothetical protein
MKTLIIMFLLLFSNTVLSEYGFYTDFAIGYHKENYDCPEACFGSDVLFKAAFGYEFNNGIYLEGEHISGKHKEEGLGVNAGWIGYKKYWDFW